MVDESMDIMHSKRKEMHQVRMESEGDDTKRLAHGRAVANGGPASFGAVNGVNGFSSD
jgi:hypothetical protein